MHDGFSQHMKRSNSKLRIPLVAAAVVAAAEGDDHDYFDPSAVSSSTTGTGGLGSAKGNRSSSLLQRISNTLERVYGGSAASDPAAAAAGDGVSGQQRAAAGRAGGCCGLLQRYGSLIAALVMCQVGMILFNIGLTYGFTGAVNVVICLKLCCVLFGANVASHSCNPVGYVLLIANQPANLAVCFHSQPVLLAQLTVPCNLRTQCCCQHCLCPFCPWVCCSAW
jgi:hypothetical protein